MSDAGTLELQVSDRIYRRIRDDVIFGRLAPGRRLTLERMREAYGASVTTLREALSRLSSEGFVAAEGARGFAVMPASAKDLRELAAMRQLLESHALRKSFECGDIEWESRVVAAYHKLSRIEKELGSGDISDPELWKQYDCAFHQALISACDSKVLMDIHATVQDKYFRYLMIAAVFRGPPAAEEHRRLLDCSLSRDWASAQQILAVHISECVAQMENSGALT